MIPPLQYGGVSLKPYNITSYTAATQLGLPNHLPRTVQDQGLLSNLICTEDDYYPAIAPNQNNPNVNPEPPTYCLTFCPVPGFLHMLGMANEDGRVLIQDTSKVLSKEPQSGFSCHDNAIFDLTWSEVSASTMVTVSGDQKVCVWDIGEGDRGSKVRELRGHNRSVKCVEWREGTNTQFATGGRDNTVLVWDTRDKSDTEPDNAIRGAHSTAQGSNRRKAGSMSSPSFTSPQGVVTALAWVDDNTLASCGDNDGVVKLWDLRKNYSLYKRDPMPKLELYHPGHSTTMGYTSLSLSPCKNYLYAACMDDTIYKYDIVNGFQEPLGKYTGASIKNFFTKMSVSPCGRYIVSGSLCNWAYLWNTNSDGGPVARLGEHRAEVTCVAWSKAFTRGGLATLVTASDDMKHLIWRPRWEDDESKISGKVEMLQKQDKKIEHSPFKPLPITPSTSNKTPRRSLLLTPGTGKKQTPSIKSFLTPKVKLTPVVESPINVTPTNEVKRGVKRRQTLDFNDENCPQQEPAKIARHDSCNRNLSTSISSLYTSPAKCEFTAYNYKSPRKLSSSPVKLPVNSPRRLCSPLKLFSPLRELPSSHCSPTANLPNYVKDGTSPRTVKHTGVAKHTRGNNWLTNYTKEKKVGAGQAQMKEALCGLTKQTGGFSKVNRKKESKKSTKKVVKLK